MVHNDLDSPGELKVFTTRWADFCRKDCDSHIHGRGVTCEVRRGLTAEKRDVYRQNSLKCQRKSFTFQHKSPTCQQKSQTPTFADTTRDFTFI